MADSYLPYQDPTTTSRKLDSHSITVGANTVERERIEIAGVGSSAIAEVTAATPSSGSWGVVVRNIPSGSQEIAGTVMINNIVDGTIGLVSKLTTGSIQLDPLSHVTITNIKGGTIDIIDTIDTINEITNGSIQLDPLSHVTVQNIKGGTLTTITTVSTITNGSIQLDPLSHVTVTNLKSGTLTTLSSVTTGSIQLDPLSHVTVTNLKGGTLTTLSSLTAGSVQLMTSGALIGTVTLWPPVMEYVTGATTGVGTTFIKAAVSGKKIKVYAYDIVTTASATYFEVKFNDGLVGGTVMVVHGLVNATANCISGIAKSVTPPSYLFCTSPGNTLTLSSSAAQPINYNISFWATDAS